MRPYSDIHVMDVYKSACGGEWVVTEKNDDEKMVQIAFMPAAVRDENPKTIWKRNTDGIFNNRVQSGAEHGF